MPLLLGPLRAEVIVAPDSVVSVGQIELSYVLLLNLIVWNITAFDIGAVYLY